MKSFKYVITDEVGIHARPAGILAKEAKSYNAKITMKANGKSADVTRLIAIMAMGVKKGQEVTVEIEGEDEADICSKLQEFFESNF